MTLDPEADLRKRQLFDVFFGPRLKEMGCVRLTEMDSKGACLAQVAFLPSMEVRLHHVALGLLLSENSVLVIRIGRKILERQELRINAARKVRLGDLMTEIAETAENREHRGILDGAHLWGNVVTLRRSWETESHVGNLAAGDRLARLALMLFEAALESEIDVSTRSALRDVFDYMSNRK